MRCCRTWNDPIGTPNTVNDVRDVDLLQRLGVVAKRMTELGIPLDVALGELQVDGRMVDDPVGVPGGTNTDGTASIVGCCANGGTLAPEGEPGERDEVLSLRDGRYPITTGNIFMMVVAFGPDGPSARAVLADSSRVGNSQMVTPSPCASWTCSTSVSSWLASTIPRERAYWTK